MKRRIIYVWLLVVLILCNNMFAFATESEAIDYEDVSYEENVVEETTYPFQSFADKSIPGVSIEGSVDEDVFPSGTTMNVLPVTPDVMEQIKISTDYLFNGNQKVVDIIALDISFSNENEKINPQNGKAVSIVVRSESLVERKNYIVIHYKSDQSVEIIPATETVLVDATVINEEVSNYKKEISFDIKESDIYAIVETEEVSDSTTTDIIENEVYENETSDNQYEEVVEPSDDKDEAYESKNFADQDEDNMTEATDPNDDDNSSDWNESEKSETSTEQKETDKSDASTEQKDTKKSETSTKQNDKKETNNSVEKTGKISVTIEAKWDDIDDEDDIRPEDITVYLLANGKRVDAVSLTEKSQWKHTESLPEYELNDKITYTVEVSSIDGYETVIDGFTIKNSHKPATVSVEGRVSWEDENNHDRLRPESVTITLKADGEKKDETSVSEKEEWKFSFENLPKYKSGKEIKYTIEQKEIKGYKAKSNGFDIVNMHSLETITIEGVKMWDDQSNKDKIRPESITVNLIADGKIIDTSTASKDSDWKYSFGSLPKYKDGKEIVYTIKEVSVEGYTEEYYGYNITNVHKAGTANKSESDSKSNKAPKVGDNNNVLLWILVVILSIGVVLYLIIFRRKE